MLFYSKHISQCYLEPRPTHSIHTHDIKLIMINDHLMRDISSMLKNKLCIIIYNRGLYYGHPDKSPQLPFNFFVVDILPFYEDFFWQS